MKKRIVLFAALMLLSLAACGKKENAESKSAERQGTESTAVASKTAESKTAERKTPESKTAAGYKDGTYSGEAEVKEVGGTIKLELVVSGGKITSIDMQNLDREGKEKGEDYGKSEPMNQGLYSIAQNSILGTNNYPSRLIESQDPDQIDAVSGATLSRDAFVQAAKAALDSAK